MHLRTPSRGRGRRGALVAVALALLATACRSLPDFQGPTAAPKVVVIGDSFVVNGKTQMTNTLLGAGYQVSAFGEDGLDTPAGEELFDQAVATGPRAVVVLTTANDAFALTKRDLGQAGARDENDVLAHLVKAFGQLDPVPCKVWMLIDEHAAFYGFGVNGPKVNQVVIALATGKPRVRYMDWRNKIAQHPDWALADNFHVNATGSQALADEIKANIAACPA